MSSLQDAQFRSVLNFFGLSWKGYRKVRKGVEKRLSRMLEQFGYARVEDLLAELESDPVLKQQVAYSLTVSISRFFRDRKLWEVLQRSVLPAILAREQAKVKVWSAGCARGEEVYSFRILWEQARRKGLPVLELWGTDLNPEYLDQAISGIYSASSLKEVPEEWREIFLPPAGQGAFRVKDFLKEGILWREHDLLADDPPARDFHLLFLRNNLLTYYQPERRDPALAKILESLRPGGFLVIGAHEKLPSGFRELVPCHPGVFQKTSI